MDGSLNSVNPHLSSQSRGEETGHSGRADCAETAPGVSLQEASDSWPDYMLTLKTPSLSSLNFCTAVARARLT
jgi:hypothetical protein